MASKHIDQSGGIDKGAAGERVHIGEIRKSACERVRVSISRNVYKPRPNLSLALWGVDETREPVPVRRRRLVIPVERIDSLIDLLKEARSQAHARGWIEPGGGAPHKADAGDETPRWIVGAMTDDSEDRIAAPLARAVRQPAGRRPINDERELMLMARFNAACEARGELPNDRAAVKYIIDEAARENAPWSRPEGLNDEAIVDRLRCKFRKRRAELMEVVAIEARLHSPLAGLPARAYEVFEPATRRS